MHPKPDLKNIFAYHAPTGDKGERHQAVRDAALAFAEAIDKLCPDGADKSAAIRQVREAMFTANAALALDGKL
jgi:hypothetical protein